eukprot:184977_1
MGFSTILSANGKKDLSNVHTSGNSNGLTIRVTHTGGEPISSGARKHLIGTNHVERMHTDTDVVSVLTNSVGQMLVDSNTARLQSLGRNLLLLVAHQMGYKGEEIDGG